MGLRRRRVWVAAGVVVLLAAGGVAAAALTREPAAATSTPATATVDRGTVSLAVATTGTVTPAQSHALGFGVAGTVTAVAVHPGDRVTKNQVLARVDATDAQDQVDTAETAADRAADDLAAAEKSVTDCAAASRAAASRAAASRAAASRAAAQRTAPSPAATATPRPTRGATPRPAVATSPPVASQQAPDRAGGCAAPADDPVLRARRQVTAADLTLAEARDALSGTTIRAPIAGTVLSVAGAVGATVTAGNTFVTLADPAGMQVRARFPEADAGRLDTGQAASVTLADRPGTVLDATVVQVDPVGTEDGALVVFGAQLAFDTPPGDLLVGQSAAVRVTVASRSAALRVPSTAVRADDSVLVRTPAGDQPAQVGVGLRGDAYTEITSGLIDGQEIVTASS